MAMAQQNSYSKEDLIKANDDIRDFIKQSTPAAGQSAKYWNLSKEKSLSLYWLPIPIQMICEWTE